MEIWVEFRKGRLSVSPETAKIVRGSSVTWRFRTEDVLNHSLRWTVYFPSGHPFSRPSKVGAFKGTEFNISIDTEVQDGQHVGASTPGSVQDRGHYKYGVRLQNPNDNQELGDEDPYLIVT